MPRTATCTAYNLVGFQTNLTFGEQERVFRMIPGLEDAEFLRYGVMHRNTFVDAPRLLDATLALRATPASPASPGQLTGTEGYLEAAASGLLAALNTFAELAERLRRSSCPDDRVRRAHRVRDRPGHRDYQPMHVNFGLVPPLAERVRGKRERYAAYAQRAHAPTWRAWLRDAPDATLAGERDRCLTPAPADELVDRFLDAPRGRARAVAPHGARVLGGPGALPGVGRARRRRPDRARPTASCARYLAELDRARYARTTIARRLSAVRSLLRLSRRRGRASLRSVVGARGTEDRRPGCHGSSRPRCSQRCSTRPTRTHPPGCATAPSSSCSTPPVRA